MAKTRSNFKITAMLNKKRQVVDTSLTRKTAEKHLKDYKKFGVKSARIEETKIKFQVPIKRKPKKKGMFDF